MKMLDKHSRNEANHSGRMHQIHGLQNAPNPRSTSTVKTAVFSANSSLPPLTDRRGKLVWSVDEKASLSSVHFDAKQCTDSVQQHHSYDPSPVPCGRLPV